jgi:lysozyme family protein
VFGALTQNIDFECNAEVCFSRGPANAQLKALQTTINFFAARGGFAPLNVDGFIGDKTVAAANAVAAAASIPSPGATRQVLTANALAFMAQLQSLLSAASPQALTTTATEPSPEIAATIQQVVTACRTSKQDPTCAKAALMCQQVHGTPTAKLADVAQICGAVRGRTWIWWVVGGVAAATGVGLVLYHRKRP